MRQGASCFLVTLARNILSCKSSLKGVFDLPFPSIPIRGYGGNYSPHHCQYLQLMKRQKHHSRVCRVSVRLNAPSRHHRYLNTPLWLILYWIDLAISTSGFFSRRCLLRLRNDLLTFLNAPSGDVWEVGLTPKQEQ